MLIDDVLDEVADAVTRTAEESGSALDTVKRVIADGYLMLVVLAEFNRGKESGSVIFKFALALLGGGTGWLGLSGFALFSDGLNFGVGRIFHSFREN